uniref:Reverse transcriptase n=1 Tax=Mirabilis jalapa TaxID=3538 RepID=A0A1B3TNV1_MIRJA|nr:reverse transcriptase [Mirabilis jalapa]AOW44035.1 reverse transcriptase [Mirabilis jalapa]AOW44037.1 reverse transcriptase [Mirabilis jalapa]
MVTRARSGIHKPRVLFDLLATQPISPLPKTYRTALKDPNWFTSKQDEFDALIRNNTWTLVSPPIGANIISGKWIFRHKIGPDGTLDRYKARWVVRGFNQQAGIDYDETFSPVVKPTTVRTVLCLAVSHSWQVHQLDVKNAFLHGTLTETVYCTQPPGFVDKRFPDSVCRLNKALYGLKQAPRSWFQCFAAYATSLGFRRCKSDSSLFVYRQGSKLAYLLLYVDDIIITTYFYNSPVKLAVLYDGSWTSSLLLGCLSSETLSRVILVSASVCS